TRDVEEILVGKGKQALAQSIYRQVKGGADFAKLAKKYSQDPGSKNIGGKYTAKKGQDVPEFDAAVFSNAKKGTLLQPVSTKQYGSRTRRSPPTARSSSTSPATSSSRSTFSRSSSTSAAQATSRASQRESTRSSSRAIRTCSARRRRGLPAACARTGSGSRSSRSSARVSSTTSPSRCPHCCTR